MKKKNLSNLELLRMYMCFEGRVTTPPTCVLEKESYLAVDVCRLFLLRLTLAQLVLFSKIQARFEGTFGPLILRSCVVVVYHVY